MRAHAPAVLIRLCCFRVSCINLAFTILCPLSIFLFFFQAMFGWEEKEGRGEEGETLLGYKEF